MNPRNEGEAFTMIDGTRDRRGYAAMPRYREPMHTELRVAWGVAAVFGIIAVGSFAFGWVVRWASR